MWPEGVVRASSYDRLLPRHPRSPPQNSSRREAPQNFPRREGSDKGLIKVLTILLSFIQKDDVGFERQRVPKSFWSWKSTRPSVSRRCHIPSTRLQYRPLSGERESSPDLSNNREGEFRRRSHKGVADTGGGGRQHE
jgi:hypothetical protein